MPDETMALATLERLAAAVKAEDISAMKAVMHQPAALDDYALLKECGEFGRWMSGQDAAALRADATFGALASVLGEERAAMITEVTKLPAEQLFALRALRSEAVFAWDGARLSIVAIDEGEVDRGNIIWR